MINNFKETVQAMSAKEIIMAMVDGLKDPVTKIDMYTYGEVKNGICYGCAATNVICKIGEISEEEFLEVEPDTSMLAFGRSSEDRGFLDRFEEAINSLRKGNIDSYNLRAKGIGIATIKYGIQELPRLENDYTGWELMKYVELANLQA
jgi:hypothetical protein